MCTMNSLEGTSTITSGQVIVSQAVIQSTYRCIDIEPSWSSTSASGSFSNSFQYQIWLKLHQILDGWWYRVGVSVIYIIEN